MPKNHRTAKLTETTCAFCGADIVRLTCQIKAERVYCNRRCQAKGSPPPPPQHPPLADRFWAKVDKTPGQGPKGECWEWRGMRKEGYGYITRNGRRQIVSRVSWEIHNGSIPPGMEICHHCDNPPCVRLDHLFAGTHQENMADMNNKGRWNKTMGNTILNEAQVREIRERYARGGTTYVALGEMFGVGSSAINHIIHRRTWPEV